LLGSPILLGFSAVNKYIVSYDGSAVHLENATFINCIFEVHLPITPPDPAESFVHEILVNNIGQTPTFTVSVG